MQQPLENNEQNAILIKKNKELTEHLLSANKELKYQSHLLEKEVSLHKKVQDSHQKTTDKLKITKQEKQSLFESKKRLHFLLNSTNTITYIREAKAPYSVTFISENIYELTGYTPQDFIRDSSFWSRNLHPDDKDKVFSGLSNLFEEGAYTHDYRWKYKNGEYRWMVDELKLIYDEQGKPIEIVGNSIDISNVKKAEVESDKNKQSYKNLLEKMDEGFIVDNMEGKVMFANEKFLNIFNLLEADIDNLKLEDYVAPEYHEMLRNRHNLRIKGEKVSDLFEYEGVRKDGEKIWVEARVTPVIENGTIKGTQSLIRDITLLKKAEKDLLKSENRFRNLFENAPESSLVIDLKTLKFEKVNYNAIKLFKLSDEEFIKKGPVDISPKFQPDGSLSEEKAQMYIEKAMLGERVSFEWMHCDANKKNIPCEVHLALLPESKTPRIYASIVDISERKEIREKLKEQYKTLAFQNKELEKRANELIIANKELAFQNEESQKRSEELKITNTELLKTNNELDRFVYSASHDLRSPLKSLLGLSDLIIEDMDQDNINQLEQMDMMKKSILKLDNFIEDILQYSRNARTKVAQEDMNFEEILQGFVKEHKHMDGAKQIKLKVDIDQDVKFVSDKTRVKVVLNNLISNAIKYKDPSKENPVVRVDIKCSKDKAIIGVEDNGIGIETKDLEKIFEMFHRATKTSKGSGLGLYIVKETLDKINGSINVESELGKRTRFIVSLPNQLTVLN